MSTENTQPNDLNPEDDSQMHDGDSSANLSPEMTKITELETALKDEKSKYLYLYADFDNFKKRAVKERSDAMKFGWESVARDLLGVVDNLERAVDHISADVDPNLKAGIEMTVTQFRGTLEKQGVALIPSKDVPFNPELHEAISQEPSSLPSGTITQTLTSGYTLHGRLLRPAKVVVSSGTPAKN